MQNSILMHINALMSDTRVTSNKTMQHTERVGLTAISQCQTEWKSMLI